MKRKYAYVFPIGNQIQWSNEDPTSLVSRAGTVVDLGKIANFITHGSVGSFIKLSTGEMVFQIA